MDFEADKVSSASTGENTVPAVAPLRSEPSEGIGQALLTQAVNPARPHPIYRLAVQVKLLEVPPWFALLGRTSLRAERAALRAVAMRSADDKTSIATTARRAMTRFALPSRASSALEMEVQANWRSYKGNFKQGKRAKPLPKNPQRFLARKGAVTLKFLSLPETKRQEGTLTLNLRIKTGHFTSLRFECGRHQERLLSASTSLGETEFVFIRGTWRANLSCSFPISGNSLLSPQRIAVIRIGMNHLVRAIAVDEEGGFVEFIERGDFYGRQYEHGLSLRRHLHKKGLMRVVRTMGHRESRAVKNYLHILSKTVVSWLALNQVGCVVIGTYTGFHPKRRGPHQAKANQRLSSWPRQILTGMISYKAIRAGIAIETLHEGKICTSQKCWICGQDQDVESGANRRTSCRCGYQATVEWNAIRAMLAEKGIEGKIFRRPGTVYLPPFVGDKESRV